MTRGDDDDMILNVRIPSSLASQLDEAYKKRGFKNKSEFVRTSIRDAINPPEELSEEAIKDIEKSKNQIEDGRTFSLSELRSRSDYRSTHKEHSPSLSEIASQDSLGDLQSLFSTAKTIGESTLNVVAIGCGGAGNNIIHRISKDGTGNIRTVAINTDRHHLDKIEADTKLLIGKSISNGLGAGGDPNIGEEAAKAAEDSIKQIISGADVVFITGGLGGGTGTGAAPIVAKFASQMEIVSLGLVTLPFKIERARLKKAEEGIDRLRSSCDSIIIFDNNLLLDYIPSAPIGRAFSVMEKIIAESMENLVGTFAENALVDLDFADFTAVVQESGVGGIMVGEGELGDVERIVDQTLQHPLMSGEISTAKKGLVQITGSKNLTVKDAEEIVEVIFERMGPDRSLIWGAQTNENMDSKIRAMVLLTGMQYTGENLKSLTVGSESSEDVELLSNFSISRGEETTSPV